VASSLRVLLVEDSPTDAKLVLHALRDTGRTVESRRVETAAAMREALEKETWDLVISDWSMPDFSAPAALATLRASTLDLPFIIVSGTIGEDTAVDAMRAGAHDYVLKDRLNRLAPAVERELRECQERGARRQTEIALQESQARFQRLSASGIIGITIADVDGGIFDANETYLKMLGYSRDDLLAGRLRWSDLTPPDADHVMASSRAQLETSGVAQPWEMESLRKDGSRIPLLVGVAMLDQSKCIAFALDLSALKRAEADKARLGLEAREEQAGRERAEKALRVSEEQLRHAQKMEAVGRLAGGVAHDFNNVLSVILGYGGLMLGSLNPSDPLHGDVDEICKAASRAADLTRQLLLFSRHQVLEPRVVDLHDVLTGMAKMVRRILGEDVELVMAAPMTIGRVRVDPSHIEQVILNLVVNARDAMPTGGTITIETSSVVLDESYCSSHLRSAPGPYVMMAVTDTGIGMDRATQERIFEPFFTTKEPGKGTGLGLSTVFGIIQRSGGSIWVDSEPGKGSCFKVYLPKIDAAVDVPRSEIAVTTLRGSETILLVEDEDQVRTVITTLLQRQGYRVLAVGNGADALALCETHTEAFDLLLTDVVMPRMSGPELARRVSAIRPGIRILCMSGYTDDSITRHGVLAAEMAHLQKPITPQVLARKVREVLDAPDGRHIRTNRDA